MKIVIAAGGTGGHLFPGLAVGEVLLSRGHEVMLLISEKEIDALATQGSRRISHRKSAGASVCKAYYRPWRFVKFRAPVSRRAEPGARRFYRDFQARRGAGHGRIHLHGADPRRDAPGKSRHLSTNRTRFPARRTGSTRRWPRGCCSDSRNARSYFPESKCEVTGTPIRRLARRAHRPGEKALAAFGLEPGRSNTCWSWAEARARTASTRRVVDALPEIAGRPFQIIHLAGKAG